MNPYCIGVFGQLFGHHFVTVWDSKEAMPENMQVDPWGFDLPEQVEAYKLRTRVVKSIHCTRCGETLPIT